MPALQPALAFVNPAEAYNTCPEHIQSAAQAALRAAGYHALANLDCQVVDGSLVVSGTVPSYYLKQVAQAVLLRLAVARCVKNCVSVRGS